MNLSYAVLGVGLLIGFLDLHRPPSRPAQEQSSMLDWPATFEGEPMRPLPLSDMERGFAESFPGAIAHFQCGERQIILRHVERATRKLHSSATCLRAAGFKTGPQSMEQHDGTPWAVYKATQGTRTLRIREQIRPRLQPGTAWTDVSAWFWHATMHPDRGPWIAATVLEDRS